MSDAAASWSLSRQRFVDEISGLSAEQLNWRIHPDSLTIGEMALHVAGVEVSFSSQLAGIELGADAERLKKAATEGVVNDHPFPFEPSEITPESVAQSLDESRRMAEPIIAEPTEAIRHKQIKSALGPIITGDGALARLGFHAAYHQGQAYLIRHAPGFPAQQPRG